MNRHMAGLSTDGTETREWGLWVCVCMCCRGEGAHAEVTDWNNGADERRESCLGSGEGDYWASRSSVFIRVDNTETRGMEETEGGHRAAEVCRPPTQRQPHAPVSGQLFKSVTSTMLNRYTLCVSVVYKCVHLYRLVGMCVWFFDWLGFAKLLF